MTSTHLFTCFDPPPTGGGRGDSHKKEGELFGNFGKAPIGANILYCELGLKCFPPPAGDLLRLDTRRGIVTVLKIP